MDYKYIEQLLERYWACETSKEEEDILRAFFRQRILPEKLARYRSLFDYEAQESEIRLGDGFDRRVMEAAGIAPEETADRVRVVKLRKVSVGRRLRPLYRAVAAVAIVTLAGTALDRHFNGQESVAPNGWDYNQALYEDSYTDPQKAFEVGMKALDMFREGAQTAAADSTADKRQTGEAGADKETVEED